MNSLYLFIFLWFCDVSQSICLKDGIWDSTETGDVRVLPCEGELVGQMTRRCRLASNTDSVWDEPDTQYCLTPYAPKGKAFIDLVISISNSKPIVIANNPNGIVKAFNSVFHIFQDDISVYRIAKEFSHYTSIQIRICTDQKSGYQFYQFLNTEFATNDLVQFLIDNNNKGLNLQYLSEDDKSKCHILISYGPYYNQSAPQNNGRIILVSVIISIGIIVVSIIGFYSFIQVKRCLQEQRKAKFLPTSPREVDDLPVQLV